MLIIGAKGFAKEVLEVIYQADPGSKLAFYDDLSTDLPDKLYDRYPVIRSLDEAKQYFAENGNQFTIGIGGPKSRKKLCDMFTSIGGELVSTISPQAHIGSFGNTIGEGCNIMTGTVITNNISIGKAVLINLNCTVGHDCIIEEFVEMSPGVHVSGNCKIGAFVNIGTNATILPKVTIGKNSIIAAGSVVTKDVPENVMVAGVPAIVKKELAADQ